MGDTEQFDDPKPPLADESISSPGAEGGEPATENHAALESAPTSAPVSQNRPQVRRSSLRPAPPSFRPSARNPAQFRPAMVIHAGDAEPSDAAWDIPEPPPSHPSQIALDSVTRIEPFALAEDLAPLSESDAVASLVIPPPAAVPRETLAPAREKPSKSLPIAIGTSLTQPVPAGANASKRRRIAAIALCIGLVGVVAATIVGRRNGSVSSGAASDTTNLAPTVSAVAPATPHKLTDVPAVNPAPTEAVASSALSAPPTSAAALPGTTRVTLDVKPTDAKVILHGVAVIGPPYVFDVPDDKHIAVEVARTGFVTRKVVLDDKKPNVSIGLLYAPQSRGKPRR